MNAAVKRSIRDGDLIKLSDRYYKGRPPIYARQPDGQIIKVAKGIPYVRVEEAK